MVDECEQDISRIEKNLKTLVDEIKKCNSPVNTAGYCIFEIVNQAADNYYESIGLLQEAMLDYRDTWNRVMEEEAEKEEHESEPLPSEIICNPHSKIKKKRK